MIPLSPAERLLVYGIGNPGRQDDALGVRAVERLEAECLPATVTFEANYQLAPEDALTLSQHDVVIFVDATVDPDAPAPWSLRPVEPQAVNAFSSHALGMGTVLELCARLYGRAPRAYALALPAYEFEVNAELSPRAVVNLASACDALRCLLESATGPAPPSVP
jgi:hydrogenase maturation protease